MLLDIIKIQTFYIDNFSIWESLSKQYAINIESHTNYMKLYVRIVFFQLHLSNTLSNAKRFYILNADLDEWNNIGIHDFRSWDHRGLWKPVCIYEFIQNSKLSGSNFFKWKGYHLTKCRTWWV